MEEIFYTKEHFWVSVDSDIITVGLTDYIIENFSMVSLIDLPQISTVCNKTELIGSITYNEDEIFEIYSPFTGEIVESNDLLIDNPEQIFNNEKKNNWLFRIFINEHEELEYLISEEEYNEYIEEI